MHPSAVATPRLSRESATMPVGEETQETAVRSRGAHRRLVTNISCDLEPLLTMVVDLIIPERSGIDPATVSSPQ